jgi:hypothetical protein
LVKDCAVLGIYVAAEKTWHPMVFVTLTAEIIRGIKQVHDEILQIAKTKLPHEKQLSGSS